MATSAVSLLAFLEHAGIVSSPELRAKAEALAAQYPDGKVPFEKAQALLAEYLTPEVIAAKLPEFTEAIMEFFRVGLGPPTFHPHTLAR